MKSKDSEGIVSEQNKWNEAKGKAQFFITVWMLFGARRKPTGVVRFVAMHIESKQNKPEEKVYQQVSVGIFDAPLHMHKVTSGLRIDSVIICNIVCLISLLPCWFGFVVKK